jgi:hypothetical protein
MSDTQVGGNGSVHWLVRPDAAGGGGLMNVEWNGRQVPHGIDYHRRQNERGTMLTVRIKLPEGADLGAWSAVSKRLLTRGSYTVAEIEIPLENDKTIAHTQVQIAWGPNPEEWDDTLASVSTKLQKIGNDDDLKKV